MSFPQEIFSYSSSASTTGALSRRCATCERRFWPLNPNSPNPRCRGIARSRGSRSWSAPTKRTLTPREGFHAQKCSKLSGVTARILKHLRRTAPTSTKSSRPWRSGAAFRRKRVRFSTAKCPSGRTRPCGRTGRRGREERWRGEMIPVAPCTHWPVGRASPQIFGRSLGHVREQNRATDWRNVKFSNGLRAITDNNAEAILFSKKCQ